MASYRLSGEIICGELLDDEPDVPQRVREVVSKKTKMIVLAVGGSPRFGRSDERILECRIEIVFLWNGEYCGSALSQYSIHFYECGHVIWNVL